MKGENRDAELFLSKLRERTRRGFRQKGIEANIDNT